MRAHVYVFNCNHIFMTIPNFTVSSRTRPSITQPSAKFCSPATIRASRWLMPTLGCKNNSISSTRKCRATLRTLSRYLTEFVSSVAMCVTEFVCERECRFLRTTNQQFFAIFWSAGVQERGSLWLCVAMCVIKYVSGDSPYAIKVFVYTSMFMCLYVYWRTWCLYVCIYLHICSHVYTCINIIMYMYKYVYIYTYMYVHMYMYRYIHICI